MGKKKAPTVGVPEYRLTAHVGVSYAVEAVRAIKLAGKEIFRGAITSNQTLNINLPNLFGGSRNQGGAIGRIDVMLGGAAQFVTSAMATKFGRTPATMPGFRGLCTLFFYDLAGQPRGFLWRTNTPQLPEVEVETTNLPRALGSLHSAIPRGARAKRSIYFSLDYSPSMSGSRISTQIAAVAAALGSIRSEIARGLQVDIGVSRFGFTSQKLEFTNATTANIDALIAFLNQPLINGTDFLVMANDAVTFFNASLADTAIGFRFWIISTDAGAAGTDDAGAAAASDLINQSSGAFNTNSGTEVRVSALNIDLTDTTSTAKFDNTSVDGIPVVSGSDQSAFDAVIQRALYPFEEANDANGAHMIWEIATTTRKKIPEARFDKASFQASAETLFDEGLGLYVAVAQKAKRKTLIQQIEAHCDGRFQLNPNTGLLEFRLIRNDFNAQDLRTISPENSKRLQYGRKSLRGTINSLIVKWTNPVDEKSAATAAIEDQANITAQQRVVTSERDYFMLRTRANAEALGYRDLPKVSLPLSFGTHEVNRELWDVIAGERLVYTDAEVSINGMVIIVTKAFRGSSNSRKTKIEWIEDPSQRSVNTPDPVPDSLFEDENPEPEELPYVDFMTAPYFVVVNEILDASNVTTPSVFVSVLGASETNGVSEYRLLGSATDALGNQSFQDLGEYATLARATLTTALAAEAQSTTSGISSFSIGQGAQVGTLLQIGTGDTASELAVVSAINGSDLTLNRGILDTTPKVWPGGTPVWVLNEDVDFLDEVTREAGVSTDYKLLSRSFSDELLEAAALTRSFTPTERPHLPFRPGNVQIDGMGFGVFDASAIASFNVTWATRNRLGEDSVIVNWDAAGDVTPEANQTVTIQLLDADRVLITEFDDVTSPYTALNSGFGAIDFGFVRVISKRLDGPTTVESLQGHEIAISLKSNLLILGNELLTLGSDSLTLG